MLVNSAVARSVGIISSAVIIVVSGVGVGVDVGVFDSEWYRRFEMNISAVGLS